MKKTIVTILLVCLTFGMAFAANTGSKIGVNAGYTESIIGMQSLGSKTHINLHGLYVSGTAEYPIAGEIAVKAEFGFEFLKEDFRVEPYDTWKDFSDPGIHLTAFLGPKYCFDLAKRLCLDVALGANILFGRTETDAKKTFNFALGVGAEVTCFYEIVSDLEVGVGGKFAWHFLNTSKYYEELKDDNTGISNIAFQVNGAVKYNF